MSVVVIRMRRGMRGLGAVQQHTSAVHATAQPYQPPPTVRYVQEAAINPATNTRTFILESEEPTRRVAEEGVATILDVPAEVTSETRTPAGGEEPPPIYIPPDEGSSLSGLSVWGPVLLVVASLAGAVWILRS